MRRAARAVRAARAAARIPPPPPPPVADVDVAVEEEEDVQEAVAIIEADEDEDEEIVAEAVILEDMMDAFDEDEEDLANIGFPLRAAGLRGGRNDRRHRHRGGADNISPFLYDLVRENLPCNHVLSGVRGCQAVVERCGEFPNEVHYASPGTRRTPLHEAAGHASCIHILQAITAVEERSTWCVDSNANTPLHLLLGTGCATKYIEPSLLQQMVTCLMQPRNSSSSLANAPNQAGLNPLHLACRAPESMVPRVVLEQLVQANQLAAARTSKKGELPLHFHCRRRDASVDVARLLVQHHADGIHVVDRTQECGGTPLHYACSTSNTQLISYLAQEDPTAATVRATKTRETPLHVLCRQRTLLENSLPAVQALLTAAPEVVSYKASARNPQSASMMTPLHYACRSRSISGSIVQALVQASPSAAAIVDAHQYLPLHYACEQVCDDSASVVVSSLLSAHGAGVQAVTRKHDTPLHLACATNKSVEAVRLLLQHEEEANSKAQLTTTRRSASSSSSTSCTTTSTLAKKKNDYGFIPLHCLARSYQPKLEIVQALLQALPQSILVETNAGETAVHLASSNCSVSVPVLQCLTRAYRQEQNQEKEEDSEHSSSSSSSSTLSSSSSPRSQKNKNTSTGSLQNKVGSTPLHDACIHNNNANSFEQIESLATLHPEWITMRNHAGFSPLQILCKKGRMDDTLITLFSRIAGPNIFQTVDSMGNTPLHSAMRQETTVEALNALIAAYPQALHVKTCYDDTPLHLACFRRVEASVVEQVAIASCAGMEKSLADRMSPLLVENTAGQSPIAIAMEEFQKVCGGGQASCSIVAAVQQGVAGGYTPEQQRAFDVLAALVKLLHYGPPPPSPTSSDTPSTEEKQSLVRACVSLHRKCVRLDPVFIRRAIMQNPQEARLPDPDGNYPLHFEASIPVEKMFLLSGPQNRCRCGGIVGGSDSSYCRHDRMGILRQLLDVFPEAAKIRSACGSFPLSLMVQNGRPWSSTFALVLRTHPEAFHWIAGLTPIMVPNIVSQVSRHCGTDTLYALIHSRPDFIASAALPSTTRVATATSASTNNSGDGTGPTNEQQQR